MKDHPKHMSIIDDGLTVEGSVTFKGQLIIKGRVKGTLVGEHIVVAEKGSIHAETKALTITIGGSFQGELHVSGKLILLSTGNCSGKISCKDIEVESGGILNAEVNCTQKEQRA